MSAVAVHDGVVRADTANVVFLLPIGLIRNLQLPTAQKLSVGCLFALGGVCILASIPRVVQVGKITGESNSQASVTWLTLWSVIEPSIAILVGCGPGFYRKATSVSRSRQTPYCDIDRHSKAAKVKNADDNEARLVPLHPVATNSIGPAEKTDSQEELVGIRVDKKFIVAESSQ